MDFLRYTALYRRKVRLFANSAREDWIRWAPCSPGATPFPGLHVFASGDWRDGTNFNPWSGPGEVGPFPRGQYNRKPPPPVPFCGGGFRGPLSGYEHGFDIAILDQPAPSGWLAGDCCQSKSVVGQRSGPKSLWGVAWDSAVHSAQGLLSVSQDAADYYSIVGSRQGANTHLYPYSYLLFLVGSLEGSDAHVGPRIALRSAVGSQQGQILGLRYLEQQTLFSFVGQRSFADFSARVTPSPAGTRNVLAGGLVTAVYRPGRTIRSDVLAGAQVVFYTTAPSRYSASVLAGGRVDYTESSTAIYTPAVLAGAQVGVVMQTDGRYSPQVLAGGMVDYTESSTATYSPQVLAGSLITAPYQTSQTYAVQVMSGGKVSSGLTTAGTYSPKVLGGGMIHGSYTVVVTFTTSGTWTCPAGVTSVSVLVIGGGGGGVSTTSTSGGGGGGGGAYSFTPALTVIPATVYSVAVSISHGPGTGGSSSWFGSTSTALATPGSVGSGTVGGIGGNATTSVGTTKHSGGQGGSSGATDGGGGGGASGAPGATGAAGSNGTAGTGGNGGGGSGNYGAGGHGGGSLANGSPGGNYGGGGGGAGPTTGTQTGGTGAAGLVIITYQL